VGADPTVFDSSTGGNRVLAQYTYGQDEITMHRLQAAQYIANVDPRELAIYTPADAAAFLGIKNATLASWLHGRKYPTKHGMEFFPPLIKPADPDHRLLSFFNLAEAHVLAATRYKHGVSIKSARRALETLQEKYPSEHPLISYDFYTTGEDLFIKTVGETENLSRPGQTNFKKIMDRFLAHIGRDKNKIVDRVFPIIEGLRQDKTIGIIHGIASGQPVLSESGVPVWIIHGRHSSGEKATSIAKDFGIAVDKVKHAIRYGEKLAA
jgi:uncharacterized protein (DUF433 family)